MAQFHYASPFGSIMLKGAGGRLRGVELGHGTEAGGHPPDGLRPFVEMVEGYFAGHSIECSPGRLDLDGVSAFRARVYAELMRVPFGEAISYGALAERYGRPGAARAVGAAMRANPLPLFVPCHRVVRADGSVGGFSAGVVWKRRLLEHEGILPPGAAHVRTAETGGQKR